ncbi:MAG TPA: hypothetical protein PKD99_03285 [Sphingopyxis sp.]|nr:hypothetical protein [Sphingopyxis sp.]HMQ19812.1 hypothetical protein [Sphingopyxis sp.]
MLALVAALTCDGAASAKPLKESQYVEVLGWIEENFSDYEWTGDPDDLLGHGWMTAKLRVARVYGGSRLPRVITVRYFGHTYIRKGYKMRVKLKREDNGIYLVCAPPGGVGLRCP